MNLHQKIIKPKVGLLELAKNLANISAACSYSRLGDTKLYQEKTSLTSADMPKDRVLPCYQEQG